VRRLLLGLVWLLALAPAASAAVVFDGAVDFTSPGGGTVNFVGGFTANSLTFDVADNFLVFHQLTLGGASSPAVGFACDTANASMNITAVTPTRVEYVVTAPALVVSTTRVYAPGRGRPIRVSGASSWSYDWDEEVVTVLVLHHSPSNVTVKWGLKSRAGEIIYRVPGYLPLLAVSLIVLAGAFSVLLLRGQTATGVSPVVLVTAAIVLIVSTIVLWSIVSAILNGSVLYLP